MDPITFDKLNIAVKKDSLSPSITPIVPKAQKVNGYATNTLVVLPKASPPLRSSLHAGEKKEFSLEQLLRSFMSILRIDSLSRFAFRPSSFFALTLPKMSFLSSLFLSLSQYFAELESLAIRWISWGYAMVLEIGCGLAAVCLFPLTHIAAFHEPTGNPTGRPILMINGYLSFGATWHYLRRHLAEAGFGPLYTMNVGSFGSIAEYATHVRDLVQKIQKETGRNDLILICHSKGGLVGSYYATRIAPTDGVQVTDIIAIGSPLAGTPIAKFGIGKDAQEMHPDHPFHEDLRNTIAKCSKTRFFSIASEMDEIVPLSSALHSTNPTRQRILKNLGHLTLLFSPQTADQICIWLKEDKTLSKETPPASDHRATIHQESVS